MLYLLAFVVTVTVIIAFLHWYSYHHLKNGITSGKQSDNHGLS